jgi:hypothetical protein
MNPAFCDDTATVYLPRDKVPMRALSAGTVYSELGTSINSTRQVLLVTQHVR